MRSRRSFPDVGVALSPRTGVTLCLLGLLLGLGAEWLARSGQSLGMAVGDVAVGWTFIASGLTAWSQRPRSRVGVLLTSAGFAWFLGTVAASDQDVIAAFGGSMFALHRGPLFHSLVAYPGALPLDRVSVIVVIFGYVCAAIAPLASNDVITVIVASLVLGATVRGYALGVGPDRHARVTAIAGAAGVALVLVGGSVLRLSGRETGDLVLWAYEAILVIVAIGFLGDLLRGRWTQTAVTKLVVELGEPAGTGTLRTRLAGALGDPSLLIAYWLPEADEYVDERGDPVALPGPDSGRAVTLIEDRGERIAALVHDPAVLDDPALVEAVSSAARIALSNVRLRAELRNQMDELAASRRRLLTASDDQRRRIEFELRKGVEQRLETVGRLLADIRADPIADATGIEEVEQELSGARMELQDFARGLLPAALTEGGLSAALPALARKASLPVSLSVEVGRLPPAVESTVYFVCSEALTNVAKHASAEHASVAVTGDSLHVEARVDDDGVGGVDPTRGSGLRGLMDRVEALGGRLLVESPLGGGTEVVVTIPFE